jgi:hypothetical protein
MNTKTPEFTFKLASAEEMADWFNFKIQPEDCQIVKPFFQGLHIWMSPSVIQEIWYNDEKLAEYITRKWDAAAYGENNHDVWKFYDSLDESDRGVLIRWFNEKKHEKINL